MNDQGVDFFHGLIVFGGVMANFMAGTIWLLKVDKGKRRFLVNDKLQGLIRGLLIGLAIKIEIHHIFFEQIPNPVPGIGNSHFCLGHLIVYQAKDCGVNAPLSDNSRGHLGSLAAPFGIAVQFRTGTHDHGRPINGAG